MKTLVHRITIIILVLVVGILLYLGLIPNLPELPSWDFGMEITATPVIEPEITATPETVPTATPMPTATPVPTPTPEPDYLRLHQINVGCANAYLIQTRNFAIVVDGGENKSTPRKNVLEYIAATLGNREIDAYIATHYHLDHIGNTEQILEAFAGENTVVFGPSEKMRDGWPLAASMYQQMRVGEVFRIGSMTLTCVGPSTLSSSNGNHNKDSLNFVLQFGERKFFLTGDYVRSKDVMDQFGDLIADCDVFQFPNHGLESFCITQKAFKHVNPEIVLVPANSSGPSQRLARNLGIDATFYDNGEGNVVIETDGSSLDVHINVQPGDFAY